MKFRHYEIHQYTGDGDNMISYNIPMNDKLTFDAYFNFDNLNKRLVAGGLYAERNISRCVGYFYLNIDWTNPKQHTLQFEPFGDEFISTLIGKEVEDHRGITEISIQEIVLRRDGGLLMIAERNKQFERRTGAASRLYYDYSTRFGVDYHFDEASSINYFVLLL